MEKEGFFRERDESRDSSVVDVELLERWVRTLKEDTLIVESHYSHLIHPDVIIVLRTHPDVLKKRLEKKGFDMRKILENAEAELVDVILMESLEMCDRVYEIDTTDKTPEEVRDCILSIIGNEISGFEPGKIDWLSKVDIGEYLRR